jgi:hypothetical protein
LKPSASNLNGRLKIARGSGGGEVTAPNWHRIEERENNMIRIAIAESCILRGDWRKE